MLKEWGIVYTLYLFPVWCTTKRLVPVVSPSSMSSPILFIIPTSNSNPSQYKEAASKPDKGLQGPTRTVEFFIFHSLRGIQYQNLEGCGVTYGDTTSSSHKNSNCLYILCHHQQSSSPQPLSSTCGHQVT